jgi:hypothetical protein
MVICALSASRIREINSSIGCLGTDVVVGGVLASGSEVHAVIVNVTEKQIRNAIVKVIMRFIFLSS